jgi:2-oxoglutarate dehydrogenase complex dehydrogenase (E1) component-like enzyme
VDTGAYRRTDKTITFSAQGKRAILNKLIEAEGFEKFIDVKYTGTKRFGLDGSESLIPALEQIIKRGGHLGVRDIVLGMAHRGRLNVLAQVMAKPHRAISTSSKVVLTRPTTWRDRATSNTTSAHPRTGNSTATRCTSR